VGGGPSPRSARSFNRDPDSTGAATATLALQRQPVDGRVPIQRCWIPEESSPRPAKSDRALHLRLGDSRTSPQGETATGLNAEGGMLKDFHSNVSGCGRPARGRRQHEDSISLACHAARAAEPEISEGRFRTASSTRRDHSLRAIRAGPWEGWRISSPRGFVRLCLGAFLQRPSPWAVSAGSEAEGWSARNGRHTHCVRPSRFHCFR